MNAVYKKHIILTCLLIFVSVAGCIALVHFGLSMKGKQARVAEVKERLVAYEENKKIFADEATSLHSIEARTAALEQHTITMDSVPELLSSMEQMAKARAIAFTITTVSTPNDKSGRSLDIDFSAKGKYEDVTGFIQTLLSQPYEIQFTKFSLFADAGTATASPDMSALPVIHSTIFDSQKTTPSGAKSPAKNVPQWELLASIKVLSF